MPARLEPLDGGIGAEIHDVDLSRPLGEDDFDLIELAFYERHVLVIRDQRLAPEELAAFGRRLGDLTRTQRVADLRGRLAAGAASHPEVAVHANVEAGTEKPATNLAARYWHADRAYLRAPSLGAILHAMEVPRDGGRPLGDTSFADLAAAYAALPDGLKARIDGLHGEFSAAEMNRKLQADGLRDAESGARPGRAALSARHRLVQSHPWTDALSLFVSPAHLQGVAELDEEDGAALIADLIAHATEDRFVYRHAWRPGDVVIWHNLPTLHRAAFDYAPSQRRVMLRVALNGPDLP